MIFEAKLQAARLVRAVSRALGRGGGTTAPGRTLLALDRSALGRLASRLDHGSVLISATNGKTTTAAMLASVLRASGTPIVHNRAGSNMHWGIATALLEAEPGASQLGLFEVDEAWLLPVAAELGPRLLLLSNLFRDQLDRYGELESLAERWAEVVSRDARTATLALNADDPLVADLGRDRDRVVYFGIEDESQGRSGLEHAADSKRCRNCGANYDYEVVYLGHLGHYRCPRCGRRRPRPHVAAKAIRLHGMSGSELEISTSRGSVEVSLPLPGLYNVYNALAAAAAGLELGASLEAVRTGLDQVAASFGRVERIPVEGGELAILLVKNPVGANEVLRTLTLEAGQLHVWLALNDGIADGRDVSWIWDVDFERLAGRVDRATCSGSRAEEMALRLKYAGIHAPILVERDLARALDLAVAARNGQPLYALPTYTALLELRDLLADRGVATKWSE
jgi:UDP-N-acetylmuramyl tripeptide synthase